MIQFSLHYLFRKTHLNRNKIVSNSNPPKVDEMVIDRLSGLVKFRGVPPGYSFFAIAIPPISLKFAPDIIL